MVLPKKREGGSDGEADKNEGDAEKKKRPRYARAPPGSLANPDWDRMLGLEAQSKWSELLKKEKLTPLEMI